MLILGRSGPALWGRPRPARASPSRTLFCTGEAKIPRSTAWRSKMREKGNVDSSSASDSMVTSLHIDAVYLVTQLVLTILKAIITIILPLDLQLPLPTVTISLKHYVTIRRMETQLIPQWMSFFHLLLIAIEMPVATNTKAQTVNLTASMKMKQVMLSRTFKRILKRSAMTVCHCTTVLKCVET